MERRRRGRPRHPDILTPAERRVLDELREGGTNAEIAQRLGISADGVKYHVSNMLGKLGLENRQQLAAWREPPRERRRRWLFAPLAVPFPLKVAGGVAGGAVAVAAIVVAVVLTLPRNPAPADDAPVPPVAPVPPPAATATIATMPSPTATATPVVDPAVAVSMNSLHACVLRESGAITCWGYNENGETDVPPGVYRAVSVGLVSYTCAVRENGELTCWGWEGLLNELGLTDVPAGRYRAVEAGFTHACALRESGEAVCWGSNDAGQATAPPGAFRMVNTRSSLFQTTCGVNESGEIRCWGAELQAPLDGKFRAVSVAGPRYLCAIREAGAIVCHAPGGRVEEFDGEFSAVSAPPSSGIGTFCALRESGGIACQWEPVQATDVDLWEPDGAFRSMSVIQTSDLGSRHLCAVRESGRVVCWGTTSPVASDRVASVISPPAGSHRAVSRGTGHACALRESGGVVCWGYNGSGQTDAPDGTFRSVSAGGWHTCAIQESGEIACWGDNDSGQIDAPTGTFRSVSAGLAHTCAVRESGGMVCWGNNELGQTDAPTGAFRSVSAGRVHACAVRESGEAICWGHDFVTQAAEERCTASGLATQECIDGLREELGIPAGTFRSVSAGVAHVCALRESGEAVCWGSNRLGQADAPPGAFLTVSAGGDHTCALRGSGELICWGSEFDPATDVPPGRYRAVSAGEGETCALTATGIVECWGTEQSPALRVPPELR